MGKGVRGSSESEKALGGWEGVEGWRGVDGEGVRGSSESEKQI